MSDEANSEASVLERIAEAQSPEVVEEVAEEAQAESAEDQQEIEATEDAVDDAEEATVDDESEEVETDAEDDGLTIANLFGVSDDQIIEGEDGEILISVKIDGEVHKVTPSQLMTGFNLNSNAQKKTEAAALERKALAEREQELQATYAAKMQQADNVLAMAEKELVSEFESVNWAEMEANDPGRAALLRQQYAARAQGIQQSQQQMMAEKQQVFQQHQQKQQEQYQQFLHSERDEVIKANPEWSDDTVYSAKMGQIKAYLTDVIGLPEELTANVTDHYQIAILQDAMAYRAGKKAVEKKIAKKLPSFQKQGRKVGAAERKAKADKQALSRLKKSGSTDDAAAAILQKFG